MTLTNIYKLINYIADKYQDGETFTPGDFNILIEAADQEMYMEELDKIKNLLQMEGRVNLSDLVDASPLQDFKERTTVTISDGAYNSIFNLPSDYVYRISLMITQTVYQRVEFMTDDQLAIRRMDLISKPLAIYPAAVIYDTYVQVFPLIDRSYSGDFVYLKETTKPYFDYCRDSDGNVIPMPVGYYVSYNAPLGYHILYDASDNVVENNVTYPNFTTSPSTSQTVELEWKTIYHTKIIQRILTKAAINLDDRAIEQYAQIQQQQGK